MKDNENRRPMPQAEADGLIEGRNAVIEALRAGTAIDKIYLAKGETGKTLGHIASRAREAGVVVVEADRFGSQTFWLFLGLNAVYPPAVQQVLVEPL